MAGEMCSVPCGPVCSWLETVLTAITDDRGDADRVFVLSWALPSLQHGPEAEGQGVWSTAWAVTQNDH